jgi:hypothetical protein
VHLVLRLHPRMFPNKREQVTSPVVEKILAVIENKPDNVAINLPSDGIGLYDLMQVVDVALNYRSSVGAELSAFGIPVVVPVNDDFFSYPREVTDFASTLDEYRDGIDAALHAGWSIENSRRAFRWFAFLFSRVAVDFSDAVSSRPSALRPKSPGLRLWVWKKLVFVFLQFGPLVRERLALRRRTISARSGAVLLDVVRERRNATSDSAPWKNESHDRERETELLDQYLGSLTSTVWKHIDDPRSLAARIRAGRTG